MRRKKIPLFFFKCSFVFLFWFFLESWMVFLEGQSRWPSISFTLLGPRTQTSRIYHRVVQTVQTGIFVDQEPCALKGWFECAPGLECNHKKKPHSALCSAGLHKLCHPTIRDESTWSKFGARGEHGDVFLFSSLGALWFSENLIRYSLHVCLGEVKNNLFSFKHSYLRHFSWRF